MPQPTHVPDRRVDAGAKALFEHAMQGRKNWQIIPWERRSNSVKKKWRMQAALALAAALAFSNENEK